jgi:hypothetical protein
MEVQLPSDFFARLKDQTAIALPLLAVCDAVLQ